MMDKDALLDLLEKSSVNDALAGAIEHSTEGGHLSERLLAAIERYTSSINLDNRHAALSALINYGGRADLDMDAICLLVSALIHDDYSDQFEAVGFLIIMAARGNVRASKMLGLLRLDDKTREELQFS